MKKLPLLLFTLLIGIMMGCSSSNPLADEAESNIESQNFEQALASAEKAIEQNPKDPLGYYYKGVALGEIAGATEDPGARSDTYEEMNSAFTQAQDMASQAEDTPGEIERIDAVRTSLWQTEHNRAVKLATDDSLKGTVQEPLAKATDHLKNATIIQPDSSLSWNVLAQVSAMNKSFEDAANAKEEYISMIEQDTTLKPNDYLQLASYYYQGKNNQKVVEALEMGQKKFPENQQLVSNLADAYQRAGEPKKAIATVERLVEQDPENPQYHLVLGSKIYQQAITLNDSLSANYDQIFSMQQKMRNSDGESKNMKQQISELEQQNAQLEPRVEELTNRAEKELNTVLEYRPNDDEAYNTLGIIYQNRAKAIFDKRNRTTDNKKAAELDKQGKEMLNQSMENYKQATEIKPNEQKYWKSLYSIYVALGMDDKASEAMKKAGMQ